MARPWTKTELQFADRMQSENKTYEEIAGHLGRSLSAVMSKITRVLGRIRFCRDCGIKILEPKGNRLRCSSCSKEHTDELKKITNKLFYDKNRDEYCHRRNEERFFGNREKIIERDEGKCVECGLTRDEHRQKWNKDLVVFNPDIKNRKSRTIADAPESLITVCLRCQGKMRVKHRSKDYSNCGGKPGIKPETLARKLDVRCQMSVVRSDV